LAESFPKIKNVEQRMIFFEENNKMLPKAAEKDSFWKKKVSKE